MVVKQQVVLVLTDAELILVEEPTIIGLILSLVIVPSIEQVLLRQ